MAFELWIILEKLKKGGNFGRTRKFVKSFYSAYWKGFQYKYQNFFYEKQFFMLFSEVQKKNGGNFGLAHFGFLLRTEIRYFIVKKLG